jgi:hypothetical protein
MKGGRAPVSYLHESEDSQECWWKVAGVNTFTHCLWWLTSIEVKRDEPYEGGGTQCRRGEHLYHTFM